MRPNNEVIPEAVERRIFPLYAWVRDYHQYEVVGLENIPQEGSAMVVFTHSLATYDILLFGGAVYYERQRLMAALVDRLVMKTPLLNDFARSVHAVVGEPGVARSLLLSGKIVGVAPGGMREALRSAEQRYAIDWERRTGFVRLALETQTPVLLAACPHADDLYTVVDNPITRFVYEKLRMPLPVAFGRGLSPLPRQIKLVHHVSAPIQPPKIAGEQATQEEVRAFHAELSRRMRETITRGLSGAPKVGPEPTPAPAPSLHSEAEASPTPRKPRAKRAQKTAGEASEVTPKQSTPRATGTRRAPRKRAAVPKPD